MSSPFPPILTVRVGSHCHGVNMPGSDMDIRGIFIPALDHFFGLKTLDMAVEKHKDDGREIEWWSIQKLVRLLVKGNPSAMNILFVDPKDIIYADSWGRNLQIFRRAFLSKRIISACVGYCVSQIHKVAVGRGTKEGHRWQLIEKFGYDVKFMYHAVMITNMSIQLIKTGLYQPLRPPSEIDYLKKIRTGDIPLDEVLHQVESNLKTIKTIESISKLPDSPDEESINTFMTELLKSYFKLKQNEEV